MKTLITKEVRWDAAHRLCDPSQPIDWNRENYGKCFGVHGHLWLLKVTVTGEGKDNGFITNFVTLKDILSEYVVEKYDHKLILHEKDELVEILRPYTSIVTTPGVTCCEHLVKVIWDDLQEPLKFEGVQLFSLELYETATSACFYYG